MNNKKIIYFFYDSVVPVARGRYGNRPVKYVGDQKLFYVDWLNDSGRCVGHSYVPEKHIFDTKEACLKIDTVEADKLFQYLLKKIMVCP